MNSELPKAWVGIGDKDFRNRNTYLIVYLGSNRQNNCCRIGRIDTDIPQHQIIMPNGNHEIKSCWFACCKPVRYIPLDFLYKKEIWIISWTGQMYCSSLETNCIYYPIQNTSTYGSNSEMPAFWKLSITDVAVFCPDAYNFVWMFRILRLEKGIMNARIL